MSGSIYGLAHSMLLLCETLHRLMNKQLQRPSCYGNMLGRFVTIINIVWILQNKEVMCCDAHLCINLDLEGLCQRSP